MTDGSTSEVSRDCLREPVRVMDYPKTLVMSFCLPTTIYQAVKSSCLMQLTFQDSKDTLEWAPLSSLCKRAIF